MTPPSPSTRTASIRIARLALVIFLLAVGFTPAARAADAGRYAGIYAGKAEIALASRDFKNDFFPCRLTVFPDGHAMILTTELPSGVMALTARGDLKGNVFHGHARGRFSLLNYHMATDWTVRFSGGEARVQVVPVNPPPGFVNDDKPMVLHKVRS